MSQQIASKSKFTLSSSFKQSNSSSSSSSSSTTDDGKSRKRLKPLNKRQYSWTTEDEEERKYGDAKDSSSSSSDERRSPSPPTPQLPPPKEKKKPQSTTQSLWTQIRILVERALAQQLRENRLQNPTQPWIRRQIDIFSLRLLIFIMNCHRELIILFLIFLSGLVSVKNSPVKTRSTPTPQPFFGSPKALEYMEDFYNGEYIDLVQNKINLGPAFVFYYAPWDSESVAARNVFVNVARYFHYAIPKRIGFYAVNCWYPQGECRKNYKNLSHFPIFVAHVERNVGIIYSGPIRTELIIKFLSSILKPLTRIDTEDELWRFRAQHDAIMLGYFNFTQSLDVDAYETYRQMALRNFEADPFGQVGFGIFLRQELAQKYFLTSPNVISLVLFNEIHTAKWSGDKDTQGTRGPVGQVANWVLERTKKTPITWAYQIRTGFANRPVALGPVDLMDELTKGPVLLLITRRYFPSSYSPFYAQMKEVALDYLNCNGSGNVTRLRRTTHKINSEWMTLWNSVTKICASKGNSPSETCILLKDQLKHWETKKNNFKRESLANYEVASQRINFTGFSCASERQFKFFAVDPVDIPSFIELGFGGLGFHNQSDPVLFIIDAQNDMILPFSTFNITELAETIYNYTNEMEKDEDERHGTFVSSFWSDPTVHQQDYRKPINFEKQKSDHHDGYSMMKELVGNSKIRKGDDDSAYYQELNTLIQTQKSGIQRQNLVLKINSEDLRKFINRINPFHQPTPMLLMYTAKFCGICGVALTSFVELARFFSDYYAFGVNVTFARLDLMENSLPGDFSPDHIPTFLYFPGDDRSDVRVFPADEKITSKTLLQFLLAELDPDNRIKLSLQSPKCISGNKPCSKSNMEPRRTKNYSNQCQADALNGTARSNCISANKISVTDKIQHIFDEIQHGYYSHPQYSHIEAELGVNVETLKTQDLDHLRSMKITLDVI